MVKTIPRFSSLYSTYYIVLCPPGAGHLKLSSPKAEKHFFAALLNSLFMYTGHVQMCFLGNLGKFAKLALLI